AAEKNGRIRPGDLRYEFVNLLHRGGISDDVRKFVFAFEFPAKMPILVDQFLTLAANCAFDAKGLRDHRRGDRKDPANVVARRVEADSSNTEVDTGNFQRCGKEGNFAQKAEVRIISEVFPEQRFRGTDRRTQ